MKKLNKLIKIITGRQITRKQFFKAGLTGMGVILANSLLYKTLFAKSKPATSTGRIPKQIAANYDLVVIKGDDPYKNTIKAIESIGGINKFVKKGDKVVIKPNIGWDRTAEQAANTNPQVIAALIDLCKSMNPKQILVFDNPCNNARKCYANSGIEEVVESHGADLIFLDEWNTLKTRFSYKNSMEDWPVYREAIECDIFINVPVLKHHGSTTLTLSMKNLMGVCAGNRGLMHMNLGKKIAEITDFIKPELNIVDAYRVLTKNGPSGGNLKDVELRKTIIAGTDPVLVDSYAAQFVSMNPMSIPFIKEAVKLKLGSADLDKAKIFKLSI